MKITIKVTAKHIREGVQRSCHQCPIAKALRVAYLNLHPLRRGDIVYTHVGLRLLVTVRRDRGRWRDLIKRFLSAGMPMKAQSFINRFDRGEDVLPFQFTTQIFRELK